MRFNKKNRKLRRKKQQKSPAGGLSFWLMLAGGLVLMGGFLFIMYAGQGQKLRRIHEEKIASDMDRICVALILFYQDRGRFPSEKEGLEALLARDGTSPAPDTGALDQLPLDPWRNPYRYRAPQGNGALELTCLGSDGEPGGTGEAADVVRQGCRSAALSGK